MRKRDDSRRLPRRTSGLQRVRRHCLDEEERADRDAGLAAPHSSDRWETHLKALRARTQIDTRGAVFDATLSAGEEIRACIEPAERYESASG